ncbi:MAG TPA: ATP-binding cassette domain-containing protein, partial [Spirochaetota bacterium]|nr:ATP-binding cassette domain-containing protein [Spirochaetota bacterium]
FGYVFQKFFLVPTLTVRENIMLPLAFYRKEGAGGDADALATMLGLESRLEHLPGELSGGEMQRVAIARALVNDPDILLADEPTGNLDSRRSGEVGDILVDLNRKKGISIILVTHNAELAARAHRAVEIRDGRIAVTR